MDRNANSVNVKHKLHLGKTSKVTVGANYLTKKKTRIVFEKDGDSVQAIRITCRCGEETIVQCIYPESD